MDLQIQDKVAIITGGSRGIGKATALKLSTEGANIALVARNESSLKETKLEILKQVQIALLTILFVILMIIPKLKKWLMQFTKNLDQLIF